MEAGHYTPEQLNERFSFSGKFKTSVFSLLGIGIVLLVLGIFLTKSADGHAHEAAGHGEHTITWFNRLVADFLLANVFYFRIALGAFVFLMFTWLGGGGWNTLIRRISEAISQYVYVAFIGFILLFFVMNHLYEWVILPEGKDELIDAKRAYLNQPFFMVRNLIFFAVWGGIIYLVRKASLREDEIGGLDGYNKTSGYAAFFMVFFALSYTFFSVDWLKSLEPHWFSTIYAVYIFAGTMVTSFSVTYLLIIVLKRNGYLSYVNDSHLHDVGKFMFGFSVFWAYIWVSQFLLIWYANVPEETIYYIRRMGGSAIDLGGNGKWFEMYGDASEYMGYKFFFFFNLIVNFITPFLVLMTRNAKRSPVIVYPLIFLLLIGHWNDVYLLIMPGAVGQYSASLGSILMQLGMALAFGGLFLFVVLNSLSKAALVPKNNPYLEESLHHSTGAV